jgi:ABC-type transport system substrate-binding protein
VRLAFLALALATGACSRALPSPAPADHPSDTVPRRGGTLRLASTFDVRALDPAVSADDLGASAIEQIFAGLVDYDDAAHVVPDLARRWEASPDGRVYRFFLREGVAFHDGTEVTAADVKRSVERALHPSTPNPAASLYDTLDGFEPFTSGKAEHLSGVEVEGRYVVAFHLREVDSRFLSVLALHALRPVCPSGGDRYDDAWLPCGAGPYKLERGGWDRSRSLRIVRHERYFRPGLPHIDAIEWTLGMNVATERYAFEDGTLDLIHDLRDADLQQLRADPRWSPLVMPEPDRTLLGEVMNTELPPFDNVEVRRAVAAAIDRSQYAAYRPELLTPASQALPPAVPGFDPSFPGQRYDPAAALDHMARAGYPYDPATGKGGYPAAVPYLVVRQGAQEYTAQILAQQLARIGLKLELRLVSWPTFLSLAYTRKAVPMASPGWGMDYPDPSDFFERLFSSKAIDGEQSTNTAFYRNPHVDELVEAARHELDPDRRTALFREANAIVCDEAPWAFTVTQRFEDVRQGYVRGFRPHPVWSLQTAETWLDRSERARGEGLGVFWRRLPARLGRWGVARARWGVP